MSSAGNTIAAHAGARPGDSPGDADPSASPPPIVFVGGTGRSGTHVVAELLGLHSRYAAVPIECRFHTNAGGFPDLLDGRRSPQQFLRKLRRLWWHRIRAGEPLAGVLPRPALGREVRGLHRILPRSRFNAAAQRFEANYERDPESACRALFLDLLWPLAEQEGKPGLVEMSTFTAARAPTLLRLFPEAKVIHSVRDGRDVGASKVAKRQKPEHPSDVAQGIDWWLGRLTLTERGIRQAPPERVLTVSLDELVEGDREAAYAGLLDFLDLRDEPEMREFFERQMNAENANRGRWRAGLSDGEQQEVAERYERALERAEEQGFASAPLLRRVQATAP